MARQKNNNHNASLVLFRGPGQMWRRAVVWGRLLYSMLLVGLDDMAKTYITIYFFISVDTIIITIVNYCVNWVFIGSD